MKCGSHLVAIVVFSIVASTPPPVSAEDNPKPEPIPTAPAAAPAEAPAAKPVAKAPAAPTLILPDPALVKLIGQVRMSPIGAEPHADVYLDLIETGKANAAQVNDFAAYVAKRGMPKIAISFQEYALRLDANDPTLWLNLGTLRRTSGLLGPAATAFQHAIAIDPANALAHYNLGSVHDAEKNYDEAVEEYRRALVLDPELADPRKNPQVVNNENLLAVKLQIYQNQAGSLGLPLLQMQKTPPPPKAEPDRQ